MRNAPLCLSAVLLLALTGAVPCLAAEAVPAARETASPEAARAQQFVVLARENARNSNFAGAEAAWREALDLQTRLYGPNSMVVGGTLLELSLQVSNQQRFDEAAALLRRAAPIIERAPDPAVRARLASYRALDAANQRNYADSYKYARDAVVARQADVDGVLAKGADMNGNPPIVPLAMQGELANALRIQAEMAMRLGDLPGAQAAAERALYIVTEHPQLPLALRPQMVSLMGDINARQGRVVVAEQDFTQALAMNRKLFGEGVPTIAAQLRLARFYADEQVYGPALTNFHEAFALIDKNALARAQIVPDQMVPFLAAATASTGSRASLDGEMFAASQLSDTGVASQTIARVAARRAADNPALADEVRAAEDAARARDDLRMQLAAEHARPDEERDALREKQLEAALPGAVTKSEALTAKVRADFPAYAGLADPVPVALSALQAALRPKEAFVSFLIGQQASYVLLATHDDLTVRPIKATAASLSEDIADLREAFQPKLGKLPAFSLAASGALYNDLLGPVNGELAGIDHLVVATSGDLANLPFALLVTGDGPKDYAHAAWLVRRTAISQIPSARAFLALRGAPPARTSRPFLGIGNPVFAGSMSGQAMNALASTCQMDAAADPNLLRALAPLPETAGEVQAIGHDLKASPDDILLGENASESAVRARPLEDYAVLYFATHGLLPGELHCQAQPGLVLSPPTGISAAASADGLLTASEIAGLKLNARLVVLSACNTAAGGGSRFGGGALEGLADAFFNAGAHAVLASHWEVPSVATTSLMTGLFENLSRDPGHDTAEALRQAQLRLIAQGSTAHPFDWAAFTLIGDGA